MATALDAARAAETWGDVPIGAVVVRDGVVLAVAANERERAADPTAHAEILALRAAGAAAGRWNLTGADLFATLEPCPMCAGAAVNARIRRIVFGAADPKAGACGSLLDLPGDARLNHRPQVVGGVGAAEQAALLSAFFAARRRSAT